MLLLAKEKIKQMFFRDAAVSASVPEYLVLSVKLWNSL
jgi:hypothetical protein